MKKSNNKIVNYLLIRGVFWTGCRTDDRRLCNNKDKAQSAHCSSGTRMSSGKPDPGQSDHGHAARFHR